MFSLGALAPTAPEKSAPMDCQAAKANDSGVKYTGIRIPYSGKP